MADDELEALRAQRMAQLQSQYGVNFHSILSLKFRIHRDPLIMFTYFNFFCCVINISDNIHQIDQVRAC